MIRLADLMTSTARVWAPEDEGASGTPPQENAGAASAEGESEGAGETEPAASTPAPAAAAQPAPAPKDDSWKDRRIAALTARLAEARKPAAQPASAPALDPTADFNSRVAEVAAQQAEAIANARAFNEACNAAAADGRAKFGAEFDKSVQNIRTLVDPSDPNSQSNYEDFLASALETGAAPALLHELGRDMNAAEKILALNPRARAIELARRAAALSTPVEPSAAPKPITPVDSRGSRHVEISASDPERADALSTADWMARRNAEVTANGARR